MGKKRMTKQEVKDYKKQIFNILKDENFANESGIVSTQTLCEETGLSDIQVKSIIHSMRRDFQNKNIPFQYYPITKSKGFKFPNCMDDYLCMVLTFTRRAISMFTTISPIRKLLIENGYDMKKEFNKVKEEYPKFDFDLEDTRRFFVEF